MRAVHLQRQRIITEEFSGRDTAYNSLLPKFISAEYRDGPGRSVCVANKKRPGAGHTQTHTRWGGRLRDRSWLTAAKLPVGWARVGTKPKPGRMTSELCTSPTQPAMRVQKWHTRTHTHTLGNNVCRVLLLTPWNCPLPFLPSPFLMNTCEMCGAVEYFGDIGLLWNMRSGDRNWQIFFLEQKDMGVEERLLLLNYVNHFILHKVCVHDFHICVNGIQDRKKKTFCSLKTHTFQANLQPHGHRSFQGVMTFPVVIPSVLFVSLYFPLGQFCLRGFHVMTHGFNMGRNN